MKTVYSRTKVLSNERPRQSAAVKDKNGNILNDKESKTERWYEYFYEVLNRENPSNQVSIVEREAFSIATEEIDLSEPSSAEIKEAKKHLKNGKAPGIDNIQAEQLLLKADNDFATIKVKEIIDRMLGEERTPGKWRKGLIVLTINLKRCRKEVIWKTGKTGVESRCLQSSAR